MQCCNYTYEKYINEDGTPDQAAIAKLEEKEVNSIREYVNNIAQDPNHDFRKPLPRFKPIKCGCLCHVKGTEVFH